MSAGFFFQLYCITQDVRYSAVSKTLSFMNIETLRDYCLSLPLATEDIPFDFNNYGGIVGFRVQGRIFAMIDTANPKFFALKCEPDLAIDLRDRYPEITPAWHMNKRHWNQVDIFGALPDELIESMIRRSYALVAAKLPKHERDAHPEIAGVAPE